MDRRKQMGKTREDKDDKADLILKALAVLVGSLIAWWKSEPENKSK